MFYLAIPLYAFLNRFRGSSQTLMPKLYVCIIMALGFSFIVPWVASLPILVLCTLALQTGHGNFIDLGTWPRKPSDGEERLEFIIKPLYGKLPEYWYDFLGLMLTGVIVTLPVGIALLDWRVALLGLLKAPCYAVGRLYPRYAVEIGETLTGAVYGAVFLFVRTFQ